MTAFLLYLLYAYVQAVLFVRFGFDARARCEAPAHVALWTVFAPILTVGLLIALVWCVTDWLAGGE